MGKDPVCGKDIEDGKAKYKTTHLGKIYYFCNPRCQKAFEEDPSKYFFWIQFRRN